MVRVVPTGAAAGVKELITGVAKLIPASTPAPAAVFTITSPSAPWPTIAVICVADTTVNDCTGTDPSFTSLTLVKLYPLMVRVVPGDTTAGVKDLITGCNDLF